MAARSIIRVTSVTLSLGLILAFAISAASADLAECRNCVEAKDIANGAVGTGEIKNGTIRPADIHASAMAAAGSVLLQSPTESVSSTTGQEIDRFKVKAPGRGYLLVQVTGKYYFDIDGATTSPPGGALALCTTSAATSGSACGASSSQEEGLFYADNLNDGVHDSPYFTLSRVVSVRRAGTYTFYLNGRNPIPAQPMNIMGPVRATAMFTPKLLSVTT